MRAIFGFALAEGLLLAVIGRRQMVDARQERAKHLSVADDAADRGAAKTDAVIAPLAADQADAAALAQRNHISRLDREGRDVRLAAVDREVTVAHQLPRLGA